ncbi:hypothetical protein, partial [Hymenobacter crusticola]
DDVVLVKVLVGTITGTPSGGTDFDPSVLGYQYGGALVLGTAVKLDWVYAYGRQLWRARRAMTPQADPVQGANWNLEFDASIADGSIRWEQLTFDVQTRIQGRVALVSTGGSVRYYSTWDDAHYNSQPGDRIIFGPGTFGDPNADAGIHRDLTVVVPAGTTWQFKRLYCMFNYQASGTTRFITIEGGGTLRGEIYQYATIRVNLTLSGLTHEGKINYTAFPNGGANPGPFAVSLRRVRALVSSGDYITAYTRNGGFYFNAAAFDLADCDVTVSGGGAVYRNTGDGGAVSDAAGNKLRIHNSRLLCDAGAPLIVAPDGVVSYDFSQVNYRGTVPANVASAVGYSFLGLPAGGSSTPGTGSGIDFANPVTTTQATTLNANKAYYVTGGGYALTLPSASQNLGLSIFISVAASATGLYPITGATNLVLYANESINLRATLDGWKRTGGEPLAMVARLSTTLAQQDSIPLNTSYRVPLSVTAAATLPAQAELSQAGIRVLRNARASISYFVALNNAIVGGAYTLYMQVTDANGVVRYPMQTTIGTDRSGLGFAGSSLTVDFAAGDLIQLYFYNQDVATLRGALSGSECSLTYTEIV